MRLGPLDFTPRLVPTVAAAAMVALTLSLGRWQVNRAEEKAERQDLLERRAGERPVEVKGAGPSSGSLLFRRLRARGQYVPAGQIFIDNRIHGGRAGFHVITPLAIAGSDAVILVNRGWTARTADYPRPPHVPVPDGEQVVEGLATVPPARVLELSTQTVAGSVWQNLSMDRYAAWFGKPTLPVVLLAPAAPGLAEVVEKPDAGIAKHREYALTWFSLAVTVAALWIGLNLRRAGR